MAVANRRWKAFLAGGCLLLGGVLGCSATMGMDDGDDGAPAATGGSGSAYGGASAAYGGSTSVGTGSPTISGTPAGDSEVSCPSCGTGGTSGDKFTPVGSNPFVYAWHDPLSTFAADVDTASYDIFRRYVGSGALPDPASVRLEEYVNYFAYDYPAPAADAEDPFSIHLAAASNLSEDGTLLLRVGIQGKAAPPSEKRPANLVFLVDVSGSMQSEDKLPLVKQVLTKTIGILDPTDTISIVTYAGSTAVRLTPTPASEAASIEAVINSLDASGSTAGGAGLTLAYEQAEKGRIEGGINHIVLCTDGDFNVGPASNEALLELVRSKRATGVTLTTLGFGTGNLNDSMMEAVSDAGNGIYGFIGDSKQASDYVEHRMLSTLVHIAKDMKIQVEFNPDEVYAYRLLGYENRAIADNDFRNDIVDAGEIGSGHRVTALYQIVPAGGVLPEGTGAPEPEEGAAFDGEREVADGALVLVKVRYKQPTATDADPAAEVATSLPASLDLRKGMDDDFAWAAAVASFAEVLKQSPYANRSTLDPAAAIVGGVAANSPERVEFAGLFTKARGLLSPKP